MLRLRLITTSLRGDFIVSHNEFQARGGGGPRPPPQETLSYSAKLWGLRPKSLCTKNGPIRFSQQ